MRMIFVLILICVSSNFLKAQEINEKAKKYLEILKNKPSYGFMFDRFYGAWMESSDTKELEEYLKKNSVEKPTSENILLLAFYYQKEGQTNQALGVLDSIENAQLLTGEVLYYRARLESSILNFTDSIKHIDTAIALPIKDDLKQKLLKLKAQAQSRNGDSKGARQTFEALLAIDEKDKSIIEDVMEIQLAEGLYEDAKKLCQKLIDLSADNYEKVNHQLKIATIFKRLNDFTNAEKTYLGLIGLSGQDSWLLKEVVYQFESIYRGKDNLIGLVKKYKEVIKENSQNVYLRKRYSSLLSEKGEKDASVNEFKEIVELLPGDSSIREEYASLLVSNGQIDEAIKILEALATSKSESKDYQVILNIAELECKKNRFSQANERLQQFLAKKDLTEYEILRVSNLMHKYDQVDKELELLEKYSKENPEAIAIKESLVQLYLEMKDKEKALLVVKTLNVSGDLDLNFRMINQFTKNKLPEEALVILESASKENKETYRYHKRLFDLYSYLENEGKKKEIARNILKVCTSFAEIRETIQMIIGLYKEKDLAIAIKDLDSKVGLDFKEVMLLAHLQHKAHQTGLAFKRIEKANEKYGNEILFLELQENFFSSIRELERAVQVLEELIKKSPKDNSKYLLLKMNLLRRLGETDKAIACAKQLIIATNNKAEHVIALADLYHLKGNSNNAIAILRKASFENADEKEFKIKLVDSYVATKNFSDARRILWSLLEATEDTTEKMSHIEKLFNCYESDLGLEALIENLKERKFNNAQSSFPLLALIYVYQRLDDKENRSKYMAELAQLKVDDVQLYLELADAMQKDLDYEGAEAVLKKAVDIDKGDLARSKLMMFYFNTDKDEQAAMELLRLSKEGFTEKRIVEIAEKYITSKKHEKAYELLKKYVPIDRTEVYDYILAIAAREAKVENTEMYFYQLLDKSEEFSKAHGLTKTQIYHYVDEKYRPKILIAHDAFQQDLRVYASYQTKPRGGSTSQRATATIRMPSNLSQLHHFAIAHLGDMYREGSDTQKTEILNELKRRNIEYAELFLSMDKNKVNFGEETAYKKLSLKYPDDVELKVLSVLNDREYRGKASEKLLPLINEVKEKDPKIALWLYLAHGFHLSEINQEIVTDAESLMSKLDASEDVRFNVYFMLFTNQSQHPRTIAEDLIEKYKPIVLSLFDKSMAKDFSDLRHGYQYLMPLLAKFEDVERYAKILNKQLTSSVVRNQNTNQSVAGMGTNWGDARHLSILLHQYSRQFHNITKASSQFREQLMPLIENKILKLSIYSSLNNEKEAEKTIKDLEESKVLDDLHVVVAYYVLKKKDKEAFAALNKALPLAMTADSIKAINARIAFYATQINDPAIKAEGLDAAKRLRHFNLNIEEMLELSIFFESLGDLSEAQKLYERIRKTNIKPSLYPFNNILQTRIHNSLDKMFNGGEGDAKFNYLISAFKNDFGDFSNRVKTFSSFRFDPYSFDYIMRIVKNKKVSAEFKKFVSDQDFLTDDDLVTIAFIFYKLDEVEEATHIVQRLAEKRPHDLFYKMFAYGLKVKSKNSKELDDDLKQAINKNFTESLLILRNFMRYSPFFDMNLYDLKKVVSYMLDDVEIKEKDAKFYTDALISPFFSGLISADKPISIVKSGGIGLKKDEEKIVDDYYIFFEESMLKCIKNKIDPVNAGTALFHYYVINQMPISSETIQMFSDIVVENSKIHQRVYMNVSDGVLPLPYSLPVYLLNQNKNTELNAIYEKLTDISNVNYKEEIDKLKLFYVEKPIIREDLLELDWHFYSSGHRRPILQVLSRLLQKIDVQNSHVHELLLNILREELSKKSVNSLISHKAFLKYLGDQIRKLGNEDAVNYLLDIEKRLLPEPFDKELFVKNKNNAGHYSSRFSYMFIMNPADHFDLNLYRQILKASQKSGLYFYLARLHIGYLLKIRELSVDELLASGLFSGNLSDFSIVKFDKQKFLVGDVIRKLRESKREEILEELGKMQQTDGVKLLSLLVGDKSYEAVFDFLGSKLAEFNALPTEQKAEWIDFLRHFYKNELSKNQSLSDLGNEFKSAFDNLDKNKK